MTHELSDCLEGASGVAKHILSRVPCVGELIAGHEAYNRARFDREVRQFLAYLDQRVEDVGALLSEDWLKTEEGQQFAWKVVDSALDAQLEDKQDLFANALINGIKNAELSQLEKLKFVDILRRLSRASLMVLAEMHNMFKNQVRGPGRKPIDNQPYPVVNPINIATALVGKYDPFLVDACICEIQSEGLFSNIAEWRRDQPSTRLVPQGIADGLTYNHFTATFVEFINPPARGQAEARDHSSLGG
jgi:hypothetical protein